MIYINIFGIAGEKAVQGMWARSPGRYINIYIQGSFALGGGFVSSGPCPSQASNNDKNPREILINLKPG